MTRGEELRPLYWAMVSLGVVGILILSAGLLDFFSFEPLGQRTGAHATVKGVFHYDPETKQVNGGDTRRFTADDAFAADLMTDSVDAIYSSVAARCQQSVQPLSARTGVPVTVLPGFQDTAEKAFAELGARRVWAETMTVHIASRRVMEKAGLKYVRTFHQEWPYEIEGEAEGDVEYALTRSDWDRER